MIKSSKVKYKAVKDTTQKVKDLFQPYNVGARPFLKWAGGKSQLINKFQELYPKKLKNRKIKTYYEPFLGSGAVFFDIAQNFSIESAYLSDINEELVLTYKVIQKDVSKLLDFLYRYQRDYLKLTKAQRQNYFYTQRENYNLQRFNINYNNYSESWFPRAAQFIFLNKTCFNGLYRVNQKGEFNTPAGEYENPTICDEYNLNLVNKVLELADIRVSDFKGFTKNIKSDSFIYFDPPYRPISKTANFQSYNDKGFSEYDQLVLSHLYKKLDQQKEMVMMSNSDPKNNNPHDNFFDKIYSNYNIVRIPARRMINSDSTKRGEINEIVITNYKTVQ